MRMGCLGVRWMARLGGCREKGGRGYIWSLGGLVYVGLGVMKISDGFWRWPRILRTRLRAARCADIVPACRGFANCGLHGRGYCKLMLRIAREKRNRKVPYVRFLMSTCLAALMIWYSDKAETRVRGWWLLHGNVTKTRAMRWETTGER